MNKIVRENYPVENLPDDLRQGLDAGVTVRVVVEVEASAESRTMSFEESMRLINAHRREHPQRVTIEDAVERVRKLRDEWDR